ncbi:AraC family transcriptional regulator [Hypericibacter adhaerens]|uniref:AraC family transcriptional regulator n=1 Tax=Hypericibacter adhaerens TaxID=2602016 RepID=A0A5J6MYH6_9PROT|nr:GlxA family transcriptional regulator [Hypericibacter adhaerens]QEX22157.1 AraC family transcriptional regulator [Hypericibacter adhaerens]
MKAAGNATRESPTVRRFAILIFPRFPMMAFSAVIEPLRAANTLLGQPHYAWSIVASGEHAVTASSGIAITPDHSVETAPPADYIVVCSGGDADRLTEARPLTWIRKNLRKGSHIGSVADGAFYLARAGLLDGYACTLHWQSQPAFVEAFPHLSLQRRLYVIDRTRFTSAGGVAALDMMLELIAGHHGAGLARQVAEWFVHDRIRASADREKLQLRVRTGIQNDLVLDAVARMEGAVEQGESMAAIARHLRVSIGKLERSFKAELGVGPSDYYRRIRMQRARDLLQHSTMPVREIGLVCGYASFPAFVRAFRRTYNETPRKARK